MPMFTMPLRSQMRPHSAPKTMGVEWRKAEASTDWVTTGLLLYDQAMAITMMALNIVSTRRFFSNSAMRARVEAFMLIRISPARTEVRRAFLSADANKATDEHVGGNEEEHQGLQYGGNLRIDTHALHKAGAGLQRTDQDRCENIANRMSLSQQSHRDALETQRRLFQDPPNEKSYENSQEEAKG